MDGTVMFFNSKLHETKGQRVDRLLEHISLTLERIICVTKGRLDAIGYTDHGNEKQ